MRERVEDLVDRLKFLAVGALGRAIITVSHRCSRSAQTKKLGKPQKLVGISGGLTVML